MAAKNEKAEVKEESLPVKHTAPDKPKPQESIYSAEELAAGAETLFGTRPECVAAALREKGITKCTKKEAGDIVGRFIRKEVK